MRFSDLSLGLMLGLAACGAGGSESGNDASASAKAPAAGGSEMKLDPGQWEMTYEVTNVAAPGLPAGAMAAMAGQKNKVSVCITPEEAEKPSGDIFSGKNDGNCTRDGFSMAGGRISGTMTCSGGDAPGKVTMTMDGRYSANSYALTNKMKTEAQGMAMTIESKASGRRTGDCTATKEG